MASEKRPSAAESDRPPNCRFDNSPFTRMISGTCQSTPSRLDSPIVSSMTVKRPWAYTGLARSTGACGFRDAVAKLVEVESGVVSGMSNPKRFGRADGDHATGKSYHELRVAAFGRRCEPTTFGGSASVRPTMVRACVRGFIETDARLAVDGHRRVLDGEGKRFMRSLPSAMTR
jgi:hypothetical protein